MASNGTQVFVLEGVSSAGAQADETARVQVLCTSMCFIFIILFGRRSSMKTQTTSLHPKNWVSPPLHRLLAGETAVRMVSHRVPQV